jgi:hypothetical protein
VLALAEPSIATLFRREFLGRKARAFVGAVTERLSSRAAARAKPVIFPRFERHLGRRASSNNRLSTHDPMHTRITVISKAQQGDSIPTRLPKSIQHFWRAFAVFNHASCTKKPHASPAT